MVMVLIIDIDPKHIFRESTYGNDLDEYRISPIRWYNDGVYFVDHLRS